MHRGWRYDGHMRKTLWWSLALGLSVGCIETPAPSQDPDLRDGGSPLDGQVVVDGMRSLDAAADRGLAADAAPPADGAVDGRAQDASQGDAAPTAADLGGLDGAGLDGDLPDGAQPDAGGPDGGPPDVGGADAGLDGELPDGGEPDAEGPDGELPDAALPDGEIPDVALPDGELPDAGTPDAAAPPEAFVVGFAEALDGRSPVTVRAGDAVTVAEPDGRFRLGPVPPGALTLRFTAPAHQAELVAVDAPDEGEVALEEPLWLYRGERIGTGASRVDFTSQETWLVWNQLDRLVSRRVAEGPAVELLADGFEVFLGFAPGVDAAVVRQRTVPGLAGDIYQLPLDGAEGVRLFIEAQPWVRWLPDGRALGMVHTRDALSRLAVVTPGEPSRRLSEGVPWLLVTSLADGTVAYAAGDGPDFGVYLTALDEAPHQAVHAEAGPASDAFLTTTPGRGGLMWLSPDQVLWRWTPEAGAEPLADGVLAAPRPRFLPDGRLLFWRADGALVSLWVLDDAGERLLVGGADANSYTPLGDGAYVTLPGQGLWFGDYDGALSEVVVRGAITGLRIVAGGALVLADGVVWRYRPDLGPAMAVQGPGPLSVLSSTVGGATAWEAATQSVWWIPQPGSALAPVVIAQGAQAPSTVNAREADAVYVRDGAGWRWVPLPPDPDGPAPRPLGPEVAQIVTQLGARTLLVRDSEGTLGRVWLDDGEAEGWAFGSVLVRVSSRGGYVAYTCDRGLFLVELAE